MDPAFTKRIGFREPVNRFVFQSLKELAMNAIKKFIRDEEGVTAIEYGLIASLIAILIIAGATLIGEKLDGIFQYIATKLKVPAAA